MCNIYSFYIDDIMCTHYILIYSTHNWDDAPQNSCVCVFIRINFIRPSDLKFQFAYVILRTCI